MSFKAPRSDAAAPAELTDARVSDFLRDNPDFLRRHPQLLSVMRSPEREFAAAAAEGGEVVDLQDAMLDRLRSELGKQRDQCSSLIDAGRANLRSQNRVHAAVIALLRARSLDHLIEILAVDLVGLLHVDAAALCLEGGSVSPAACRGVRVFPVGTIGKIADVSRTVTLRERIEGNRRIYGAAAGLVRSEALLRLTVRDDAPEALLALGSRDPLRFHAGQGSELLAFLAGVMEHCIRTWLDLPR